MSSSTNNHQKKSAVLGKAGDAGEDMLSKSSSQRQPDDTLARSVRRPEKDAAPSSTVVPRKPTVAGPTKRPKSLSTLSNKLGKSTGTVGWGKDLRFSRGEVEALFKFFDTTDSGVLRPQHLRDRMNVFFPGQDNRDLRMLITQPNFTVDTLWELLERHSNNPAYSFDPTAHAFDAYDRPDPETGNRAGVVNLDVVREILKEMGSDVTDEDLALLVEQADIDGDGQISFEDFRTTLSQSSRTSS